MKRTVAAIVIYILLGCLVFGCVARSTMERYTPPSLSVDIRWVKSTDNDTKRSDPLAIFLSLEKKDTVRTIFRTSSGDQVAREHIAVLPPGTYRLDGSFSPLVQGTYFVEIRNGNERMMRHVTVKK